MTPAFESSGDVLADRRFEIAKAFAERGDHAAAADVLAQALEIVSGFAAGWFALGEARLRSHDLAGAVSAFQRARGLDPDDRLGAGLHLARLGIEGDGEPMSRGYVRALFNQYAQTFDTALSRLDYAGPDLIATAVAAVCERIGRPRFFDAALDLGCGTGLSGLPIRPLTEHLVGVDLSAGMIARAEAKGIYDRLEAAELVSFLAAEAAAQRLYGLAIAADVFVYIGNLGPVLAATAQVLERGGLLAFTVESHDGQGVVLGEKLRYAHSEAYLREVLAAAGLATLTMTPAATRREAGHAVPGLVVVAHVTPAL